MDEPDFLDDSNWPGWIVTNEPAISMLIKDLPLATFVRACQQISLSSTSTRFIWRLQSYSDEYPDTLVLSSPMEVDINDVAYLGDIRVSAYNSSLSIEIFIYWAPSSHEQVTIDPEKRLTFDEVMNLPDDPSVDLDDLLDGDWFGRGTPLVELLGSDALLPPHKSGTIEVAFMRAIIELLYQIREHIVSADVIDLSGQKNGKFIVKYGDRTSQEIFWDSVFGPSFGETPAENNAMLSALRSNLAANMDPFGVVSYSPVGPSFGADLRDPKVLYLSLRWTLADLISITAYGNFVDDDWDGFISSVGGQEDDGQIVIPVVY